MIKRVQHIRHAVAAADAFVGLLAEITVDITNVEPRLHDGSTKGGIKIARADLANVANASAANDGKMTAAQAVTLATVDSDLTDHIGSTNEHPVVVAGVTPGFMSAADKSKLDGIETGATADQNAAEILALLLTVDGAGSGLDADLLDGLSQTAAATNDTIMRRDVNGRSAVATPSASSDIATKGYVDTNDIESTTKALFAQAAAPTGWTKDVDQNDKALRVVSGGTGGTAAGSVDFSTCFARTATDAHQLTLTEIPPHSHTQRTAAILTGGSNLDVSFTGTAQAPNGSVANSTTGSQGGNGFHSHNMDIRVKYLDIIKCTRN